MTSQKKRILEVLSTDTWKALSQIVIETVIGHYKTIKLLEELVNEGLVEMKTTGYYTYFKLSHSQSIIMEVK